MTKPQRVRRSTIGTVVVLGLFSLVSVLRAFPPQAPPAAKGAATDPFATADQNFVAFYAEARRVTLAKADPLILVEMDNLVLSHNGQRTEATTIPPLYHRLKAVSHIPLAIYVALAPHGTATIDDDRRGRLAIFRNQVTQVVQALDQSGFSPEQARRSRLLLERCGAFLETVLSASKYDPPTLKTLTKFAGPIVLANASDAAKTQIDGYHAQVTVWRRDLGPDAWSKLRVLVLGRQMERKHNVAVQYFAKLLGVPSESRPRLVYAEQLSGEQQSLGLLATHQLDSELSQAFFDDPDRMEADLLGNAASVYLDGFDFGR